MINFEQKTTQKSTISTTSLFDIFKKSHKKCMKNVNKLKNEEYLGLTDT